MNNTLLDSALKSQEFLDDELENCIPKIFNECDTQWIQQILKLATV